MSSQDRPHTLAILLGVERDAEGDNLLDEDEIKTAAFRRFKSALEGEDIDEQMAALDDYIKLTGSD